MSRLFLTALCLFSSIGACLSNEQVALTAGDKQYVFYQAKPLSNPSGGDAFKGSNFIHPLKTPSGFVVTGFQPQDHLHHFGLWWPWKYLKVQDRKVLCWELQQGEGLIQAVIHKMLPGGIKAESVYLDRKAPNGPKEILHETTTINVSPLRDHPAQGYFLDLTITQRCPSDTPIEITPYRYSGFTFRGTPLWNSATSTIITSEGKTRDAAQGTPARWVRVEGATDTGGKAGVLIMSHPENHAHPEKLRCWDKQHGGAVFINFNTVAEKAWSLKPGNSYERKYRLFVYDGSISADEASGLWREYTAAPQNPPTT